MSKTMKFEIVTPERMVLEEEITQITVPAKTGEITVLPGHVPLVTGIKPGVLDVRRTDGTVELISVSGGFIEVMKNKVVILADTAERAEEIDLARAEAARLRAEKTMKEEKQVDREQFTAMAAIIEKQLAREKAAKKWRKLKNIN
jgi:F-type H+-transporting ATPase subunit epsilon